MQRGNQHGGHENDDLQNWLDMTSHENPLLCTAALGDIKVKLFDGVLRFDFGRDVQLRNL